MAAEDDKPKSPPLRRYLTLEECAEVARVPVKTVHSWIYTGKLRATTGGRHRLVREQALYDFLEGDSE